MIKALQIFERSVFWAALGAAMLLMVIMSGVSFYQVITRFVFEQPSTWSEVTSRSLNIWMVYLGLVAAFRTGSLMAVQMLVQKARGLPRLILLALITGNYPGGAGCDVLVRLGDGLPRPLPDVGRSG